MSRRKFVREWKVFVAENLFPKYNFVRGKFLSKVILKFPPRKICPRKICRRVKVGNLSVGLYFSDSTS